MGPKIDFWTAFWDGFLAPSFLIDFVLIFMLFFKSRPLKFMRPRSVLLTFTDFDLVAKCVEIWSKNPGF